MYIWFVPFWLLRWLAVSHFRMSFATSQLGGWRDRDSETCGVANGRRLKRGGACERPFGRWAGRAHHDEETTWSLWLAGGHDLMVEGEVSGFLRNSTKENSPMSKMQRARETGPARHAGRYDVAVV